MGKKISQKRINLLIQKQKTSLITLKAILVLTLLAITGFFTFKYFQLKRLLFISPQNTQQTPSPALTKLTELEGIPLCPLLKWEEPTYYETTLFNEQGDNKKKKAVQIASFTVELKNISGDYFLEEQMPCALASHWYQKKLLEQGWEKNNHFDTNGPSGSMYGYSKNGKHVIFEENWGGIVNFDHQPSDYEKFNHVCSLELLISL